jgi:CRP-like cAMP-binding protein
MSRERFVELIGHLPRVLRENAIAKVLDGPSFAEFSKEHKQILRNRFAMQRFSAGATIYAQGQPSETIYILVKGKLRFSVAATLVAPTAVSPGNAGSMPSHAATAGSPDSHSGSPTSHPTTPVVRDLSGYGELFGEAALYSHHVSQPPLRAETVVALHDTEVLSLARSTLAELPQSMQALELQAQQQRRKERRRFRALKLPRVDLEMVAHLGTSAFGRVWLMSRRGRSTVYALKSASKMQVVAEKRVMKIVNEKRILDLIEHPYCASLATVFADPDPHGSVHMLLESPQLGGTLRGMLGHAAHLDTQTTRFYSSCMLSALRHLHTQSIAYRNLTPETVGIDTDGHIKCARTLLHSHSLPPPRNAGCPLTPIPDFCSCVTHVDHTLGSRAHA